jgi:hypothetical protein
MATLNIINAITESRIFQKTGRDIYRDAARAPKPIAENHRTLPTDAQPTIAALFGLAVSLL